MSCYLTAEQLRDITGLLGHAKADNQLREPGGEPRCLGGEGKLATLLKSGVRGDRASCCGGSFPSAFPVLKLGHAALFLLGCFACAQAPSAPLPSALPGTPSSGLPCVGVDAGCDAYGCHGLFLQEGTWPDPGCPAGMFCSSRLSAPNPYGWSVVGELPENVCWLACDSFGAKDPLADAGFPARCPPGLSCIDIAGLAMTPYDPRRGWLCEPGDYIPDLDLMGRGFCADADLWPTGALPGGPLSGTTACPDGGG